MSGRAVVTVTLTAVEAEALLKPERVIETNEFWGEQYDLAESNIRAALTDTKEVDRG